MSLACSHYVHAFLTGEWFDEGTPMQLLRSVLLGVLTASGLVVFAVFHPAATAQFSLPDQLSRWLPGQWKRRDSSVPSSWPST
jgi:hypothetical protein